MPNAEIISIPCNAPENPTYWARSGASRCKPRPTNTQQNVIEIMPGVALGWLRVISHTNNNPAALPKKCADDRCTKWQLIKRHHSPSTARLLWYSSSGRESAEAAKKAIRKRVIQSPAGKRGENTGYGHLYKVSRERSGYRHS